MTKLKLLSIKKSSRPEKKYMASFRVSGSVKVVHFGASGYSDYTIHKDPKRKERYLNRHRNNEDWANPMTPGALSRWILWNKPTLKASIEDFKNRFGL
jgi:hypothetical protein